MGGFALKRSSTGNAVSPCAERSAALIASTNGAMVVVDGNSQGRRDEILKRRGLALAQSKESREVRHPSSGLVGNVHRRSVSSRSGSRFLDCSGKYSSQSLRKSSGFHLNSASTAHRQLESRERIVGITTGAP